MKKRDTAWLTPLLLAPSALGLLMLPSALTLPAYQRRSLDGIMTIDAAVAACRRSGCQDWELVAYAQRLVNRKFVFNSLRNLWDTPARAFAYGMGYCSQYNLALRQILERLGFTVETVFCSRVRFAGRPDWRLGHTWLQVRVGDEWRDVCSSRPENVPGQKSFEPLRPVHKGSEAVLLLLHLGIMAYFGLIEWRALLMRQQLPAWMLAERGWVA